MIAIEDVAKNYLFDQNVDKIGFFETPIELPQDSLKFPVLFQEIPNFKWGRPRFVNEHHLEFGYYGELGSRTINFPPEFETAGQGFFTRDREKDTLHYWFLPQEKLDSLVVGLDEIDSIRPVTIKPFKLEKDSLIIEMQPSQQCLPAFYRHSSPKE